MRIFLQQSGEIRNSLIPAKYENFSGIFLPLPIAFQYLILMIWVAKLESPQPLLLYFTHYDFG